MAKSIKKLRGSPSESKASKGATLNPKAFRLVVTRTKDGRLMVGKTAASNLVNKHPGVNVRTKRVKPTHLTSRDVTSLVREMSLG